MAIPYRHPNSSTAIQVSKFTKFVVIHGGENRTELSEHSTWTSSFHKNLANRSDPKAGFELPLTVLSEPFLEPLFHTILVLENLLGKGANSCIRKVNRKRPDLAFPFPKMGMLLG